MLPAQDTNCVCVTDALLRIYHRGNELLVQNKLWKTKIGQFYIIFKNLSPKTKKDTFFKVFFEDQNGHFWRPKKTKTKGADTSSGFLDFTIFASFTIENIIWSIRILIHLYISPIQKIYNVLYFLDICESKNTTTICNFFESKIELWSKKYIPC